MEDDKVVKVAKEWATAYVLVVCTIEKTVANLSVKLRTSLSPTRLNSQQVKTTK